MTVDVLAAFFPRLAGELPRLRLAELPTSLDSAPALAARLGVGTLGIKRDDLTSPIYGGNKIRKLEFLLADALIRGCHTVVTYGSAGSNHAIATSVFAQRLGLRCHAVLLHQPRTPAVAATLRYHLRLGTRLHPAHSFSHVQKVFAEILDRQPDGGRCVGEIPWGGSNWIGACGFVVAALELAQQLADARARAPDLLYVAGGTLGTVIGLALGLRAAGLATRIVAPRVVPSGAGATEHLAQRVLEVSRALHARDPSFPLVDEPLRNIELRPEFLGAGYAEATPQCFEAIEVARGAGLKLETTYTGKAFAGLIADARAGRLAGQNVIFWNTYNSAPYPEVTESEDLSALPPEFRGYLQN